MKKDIENQINTEKALRSDKLKGLTYIKVLQLKIDLLIDFLDAYPGYLEIDTKTYLESYKNEQL